MNSVSIGWIRHPWSLPTRRRPICRRSAGAPTPSPTGSSSLPSPRHGSGSSRPTPPPATPSSWQAPHPGPGSTRSSAAGALSCSATPTRPSPPATRSKPSVPNAASNAPRRPPGPRHHTSAPSSAPRRRALLPRARAQLVAQGLSKLGHRHPPLPQPLTVSSHISHILTKLGGSSRSQIAVWVARLPPTDSDRRVAGSDGRGRCASVRRSGGRVGGHEALLPAGVAQRPNLSLSHFLSVERWPLRLG